MSDIPISLQRIYVINLTWYLPKIQFNQYFVRHLNGHKFKKNKTSCSEGKLIWQSWVSFMWRSWKPRFPYQPLGTLGDMTSKKETHKTKEILLTLLTITFHQLFPVDMTPLCATDFVSRSRNENVGHQCGLVLHCYRLQHVTGLIASILIHPLISYSLCVIASPSHCMHCQTREAECNHRMQGFDMKSPQ